MHGFITALGEKMSKSRGTGISPQRYLELGMNPEWLRYYIAAKLNDRVEDIDFNPDDFVARVNSDLVGKYVNIASRARKLYHEALRTGSYAFTDGVARELTQNAQRTAWRRRPRRYNESRSIGQVDARWRWRIADRINEAFDQAKPWALAEGPAAPCRAAGHLLATHCTAFKLLTVLLAHSAVDRVAPSRAICCGARS